MFKRVSVSHGACGILAILLGDHGTTNRSNASKIKRQEPENNELVSGWVARTSGLREGPRGNPRNPPEGRIAKLPAGMEERALRTRSVTTTAGRPRSVRIDTRTLFNTNEDDTSGHEVITRAEVLKALSDSGIEKNLLQRVEIQGKHTIYAVFNNYGDRNRFLNKTIQFRETKLSLDHPNPLFNRKRVTLVRIYNYPIDSTENDLEAVLKHFGKSTSKVLPVHDLYGLATREFTIYIEIEKDIPSYLFVGKHQVRIRYSNQPQTCRKCYQVGHIAKECTEGATCRECGAKDHARKDCPKKICFHCDEMGHTTIECANYSPTLPGFNAWHGPRPTTSETNRPD